MGCKQSTSSSPISPTTSTARPRPPTTDDAPDLDDGPAIAQQDLTTHPLPLAAPSLRSSSTYNSTCLVAVALPTSGRYFPFSVAVAHPTLLNVVCVGLRLVLQLLHQATNMPLPDEPPSSPPNASTSAEDAIRYYKSQYEQLEAELADFQSSSRELEAELEKDIEASEKRERKLKEKVESMGYEAEEWKTKYKQAKTEANSAQSTLQKEITTLRDGNRTLQLKLRDIEVANDDFERQARNTTSSLEDLESKYNVSIERGVLLEEEIKVGEQEREQLRIENQRLRDELADLKIEAHIIQEKLRKAEHALRQRKTNVAPLTPGLPVPHTPDVSEHSPATTTSSPTIATPPTKSVSSVASDTQTPPSPPFSESSCSFPKPAATPNFPRPRVSISESTRPSYPSRARHSRGPSIPNSNATSTPSVTSRLSVTRFESTHRSAVPRSGSLYQIRGLIGKMQKLEERVQSARSRLPAPVDTPPRASPRTNSALGQSYIPSSVTVRRSSRKRTSGSVASSRDGDSTPSYIPQSRNSFGVPQATPTRSTHGDSRPSSRASLSSRTSISQIPQPGSAIPQPRSESRQSLNGSRTPVGHYSTNPTTESRRPRSSLSNYSHSLNMSHIDENDDITTPTPRRSTFNKGDHEGSGIPTPGFKKRESGGTTNPPSMLPAPRRISSGLDRREGDMGPPERKKKLSEVGETY
ncbi:NADH:ubiquinone oxidoreductase [Onygenales sp. PD_12]|nr:NADH:ubiquinone oxidoreductase [Onygenales sp. PD_12]KAK2789464.1 NADH:ubiquinone oxidoreductase [Emmonsiellopsis sp. PD_33]